jgi:glycosyltransferase involved in cell wall biosynthesis
MRVAFTIPAGYGLFRPGHPKPFGGAETRASLFAHSLAQRPGVEVAFLVDEPGPPVEQLIDGVLVRHEPWPSSIAQRANQRCAGTLQPGGALGVRFGRWRPRARMLLDLPILAIDGLTEGRWLSRPRVLPGLVGLRPDVVCSFGIHAPTHHALHTAHSLGVPSVVFLANSLMLHVGPRAQRRHRAILDGAALIVAQLAEQRDGVKRVYGRESLLIPNPAPPVTPRAAPAPVEHVLWIGRAEPEGKRPELALELARRCPAVPFVLVMNPVAGQRPLFESLRALAPANARVIESVPFQEIGDWFDRAGVFVNTSVAEGFPNVFLQAAQRGVPIASLRVDPDGVLSRGGLGAACGDDLDALAQLVRRWWADAPERSRIGATARAYVAEHHDLGRNTDRLLEALRGLIASKRR